MLWVIRSATPRRYVPTTRFHGENITFWFEKKKKKESVFIRSYGATVVGMHLYRSTQLSV